MITILPLDPEKLLAVIIYLAARTRPSKFVLCKLIFLADFIHIAKYGRPIVGGRYNALPNGPVPSEALELMNSLEQKKETPTFFWKLGDIHQLFQFELDGHPRFIPTSEPDMSVFSKSDIEVLDYIVQNFGNRPVSYLWRYTHNRSAYIKATEREPDSRNPVMDYEDFFEGNLYVQPGSLDELRENYALSKVFPPRAL